MFYKKTLILSSIKGGNEKAVVNIENNAGEYIGTIKLYNFKSEPSGILSLGILENEKVIKAGLSKIQTMKYSFKLPILKNIENFSCGLINIDNGEVVPILHGATAGEVSNAEILARVASEIDIKNSNVVEIEKTLDDNNIYLEAEKEIENDIEECLDEKCECKGDKCSNCEYRKAFYGKIEKTSEENYFYEVKNQIEDLFNRYPAEDFLPSIIPNSKWVKIENEENETGYILGLIYENDEVVYICYGVPGMFEDSPPSSLNGICDWLPIDNNKPKEFGYWITYQDAKNGDTVKAIFDII